MKYIITEERLLELLKTEDEFLALKSAGVDNWEQYGYSFELQDKELQDAESLSEEMIENNTECL